MGTALAFMMAVIGLSLPEMIILRKVIKLKLLIIFAGILFLAFTLTGYLFNINDTVERIVLYAVR